MFASKGPESGLWRYVCSAQSAIFQVFCRVFEAWYFSWHLKLKEYNQLKISNKI